MSRTLNDLFGAGIGQPWLDWVRKVNQLGPGVDVVTGLSRIDYPGTDEGWDKLVEWHDRARGWFTDQPEPAPVPDEPPHRFPSGFHRPLTALEQTPAVERCGEWVSDWHSSTRQRRGLMLSGPVGTGKTACAAALAHDTDPWAFWPVVDLVQHLMDSYRDNSFGFRFAGLAKRRLLIIDDLGAERDTDGQTDLIVKLLDARHRHDGHTVITTNLTAELREARYGRRIESRLRDMCETVPVLGGDRRVG